MAEKENPIIIFIYQGQVPKEDSIIGQKHGSKHAQQQQQKKENQQKYQRAM